ncbi:hypothetical protein B9Z55_026204 [Caenorhabditis nigoni]|uniref:Uncharacterized protein n=1 Tax=Caenorhabditis nigoni TaxID=1611254 RepID=A0A2G5T2B1_9PELO|nr:hypothetical protein B9Z55_026204 [Caenorhabditis nigoni]
MLSSLLQAKYDRHELNEHFFEELDSLRYGDDSEEKQKYDGIGEKFGFWKHLSDAQKRRCILDPWRTIKNKPWNRSNKITISHDDKMEFLEQRWLLDETTCRNLLDRLLNASEADPTRQESIEKPLSDAFADSPLSFDNFHNATRDVPESDLFIRGWFERKHAELLRLRDQQRAQTQASSSDDLQTVYSRSRHGSLSNNSMLWAVDMCERIHKIQLAEKAQRALSKKRMIYSQASPNEASRHIPPASTMDLCDEIHSPRQSKCVVPKKKGHPSARLVRNVQRRRHQISYGINPIDMEAYDEHFEALHRKRFGENVSENVPSNFSSTSSTGDVLEIPNDLARPTNMLQEFLSGNNTPSSSDQNQTNAVQISMGNQEPVDGKSSPEILIVKVIRSAINRNRFAIPATTLHPARTPDSDRQENSGVGLRTSESRLGAIAQQSSSRRIEEPAKRDVVENQRHASERDDIHTPFEIEYDAPQLPIGVPDFYVPQATIGENHTSTSSQVSSPPPNATSTDNMTRQATLSIAPPPRMMESIMKKLSIEMKNREESGCLDFSQIEVDLRATGKDLDDTIAFLKNLTAQLESAKQSGSNQ